MNNIKQTLDRLHSTALGLVAGLALLATQASAAPGTNALNIIPTVTNITVINGQLVASGIATVTVRGETVTSPFSVPVVLSLAPSTNGAVGCPVLNLALAPINLDLLGLVVTTSPICLDITAQAGGGLLGNLLCNIGTLLNNGISLQQILNNLTLAQLNLLTENLTTLLNGVLQNLLQSVLTGVTAGGGPGECQVLHLAVGPLNLNVLGLQVDADNCTNGPITVDISAHHGALLGNLLCSLTSRGLFNVGDLLSDILAGLLRSGPLR